MDGSTLEHSDSDSGESWTLLENTSTYGDDAPAFPENTTSPYERNETEVHNDEDTDGISIISDSDPDSTPCDLSCDKCATEENRPTEQHETAYILTESLTHNINEKSENISNPDEFLVESNVKHKTYVHRRNKRLSTVLNIIMLGSVITAAGVAIGHMWGARNECPAHTVPSVNKILSNLYKLQEENAFLRSKLKELTFASNMQLQHQRKKVSVSSPSKQHRCKKIFEEPLNNKIDKGFKCVDIDYQEPTLNNLPPEAPEHEKQFLNDIGKLKNIYNQNKIWLDPEIKDRLKLQEIAQENTLNNLQNEEEELSHKVINLKEQIGPQLQFETDLNLDNQVTPEVEQKLGTPEKKISYADSLKTDQPLKKMKPNDNDHTSMPIVRNNNVSNKKPKDENILLNNSYSDDDIKKDDRYTGPKLKKEKKKNDRQKIHKKQKRKNKYEQWEMKGGYLKDYNDLSLTSSIGNEIIKNKNDNKKFLNPDFEMYMNKFTETDNNVLNKPKKYEEKDNIEKRSIKKGKEKYLKDKNSEWYEKRMTLRSEARKQLEHELFGDNSPNTASWYFRRMQKREQCRAQKDNSTFKKFFKQKLNFKMKR